MKNSQRKKQFNKFLPIERVTQKKVKQSIGQFATLEIFCGFYCFWVFTFLLDCSDKVCKIKLGWIARISSKIMLIRLKTKRSEVIISYKIRYISPWRIKAAKREQWIRKKVYLNIFFKWSITDVNYEKITFLPISRRSIFDLPTLLQYIVRELILPSFFRNL